MTLIPFRAIFEFFRPAFLGALASGVGIASGLNSLFGGSSGGGAPSYTGGGNQVYTPTGIGDADTVWQQMLSQIYGRDQAMIDPIMGPFNQSLNQQMSVNQQPLIGAGQQAGQQYGQLANTAQGFANTLGQQGGNEFAGGQAVYNMGMDPQNKLHDYMQQQVVDNSRAGESARGIAMSPYGAGLENDATSKFNMDWQNQQLSRGAQGLQAMGAANQVGSTDLAGSMAMGGSVPGFTMQGASAPIAGAMQAYGAPQQIASQYAGNINQNVLGPEAALMSQIIPYLNYGQGAQNSAAGFGLAGAQQQNAFGQQGLGNILAGMQNLQGNSWLSGFGNQGGGQGGIPYDPYGGNLQMYQNQADQGYSMPG